MHSGLGLPGIGLMRGGKRPFSPLDLFQNGLYSGFYYDFSKTDRTFQDHFGQAVADDDAEIVGLALEESQWGGRTLAELISSQPDLVTNGGMAADTNWLKGVGWSIAAGVAAHTGANGSLTQDILTAARAYYATMNVVTRTGGTANLQFGAATNIQGYTTTGAKAALAIADAITFGCRGSGVFEGSVDDLTAKLIPGNHGLQATAAARPTRKTGGFLRFDGSDDNLLTTLNPSAAMTLMMKARVTSASKVLVSSRTSSSDKIELATDASGLFIALAGSTQTTGANDIRGALGVYGLTVNGSSLTAWRNGAVEHSVASAGSVNTTVPFRIAARNTSGTASAYADADIYHALAINRALSASEILALTNFWGTT